LLYLNDLLLYFNVNEGSNFEVEEILTKKKFFLKEMISFELKKTKSDRNKSLTLINTLLSLYENDSSEDDVQKNQNELHIIELLKKRSI